MASALAIGDYDVLVKQGTDVRLYFVYYDANRALLNFTGHTCRFKAIYRDTEIDIASAALFTDAAGAAISKALGKIHLHLTKAQSRTVPVGRLMKYAVELVEASGDQRVLQRGYMVGERGDDNDD